jgi:hypothetical protein
MTILDACTKFRNMVEAYQAIHGWPLAQPEITVTTEELIEGLDVTEEDAALHERNAGATHWDDESKAGAARWDAESKAGAKRWEDDGVIAHRMEGDDADILAEEEAEDDEILEKAEEIMARRARREIEKEWDKGDIG